MNLSLFSICLLSSLLLPSVQISFLKKEKADYKASKEYKKFEECLKVLTPFSYDSNLLPGISEDEWAQKLKEDTISYLSSTQKDYQENSPKVLPVFCKDDVSSRYDYASKLQEFRRNCLNTESKVFLSHSTILARSIELSPEMATRSLAIIKYLKVVAAPFPTWKEKLSKVPFKLRFKGKKPSNEENERMYDVIDFGNFALMCKAHEKSHMFSCFQERESEIRSGDSKGPYLAKELFEYFYGNGEKGWLDGLQYETPKFKLCRY